MTFYYEFSEREIHAIHEENVGASYLRINRLKDRIMQARIDAALGLMESDSKPNDL